jgi:hypothetical protein
MRKKADFLQKCCALEGADSSIDVVLMVEVQSDRQSGAGLVEPFITVLFKARAFGPDCLRQKELMVGDRMEDCFAA